MCPSGEAPDGSEHGHDAIKDSHAVAHVETMTMDISRRKNTHTQKPTFPTVSYISCIFIFNGCRYISDIFHRIPGFPFCQLDSTFYSLSVVKCEVTVNCEFNLFCFADIEFEI